MNPFERRSDADAMDEEEQRDALLFGQTAVARKTPEQQQTKKLSGFAAGMRMVVVAGAVAVSLSVALYYRKDLTAANLLRIGVGDAKPDGTAAGAAPLMTASGLAPAAGMPPLKAAAPAAGAVGTAGTIVQAGLKATTAAVASTGATSTVTTDTTSTATGVR